MSPKGIPIVLVTLLYLSAVLSLYISIRYTQLKKSVVAQETQIRAQIDEIQREQKALENKLKKLQRENAGLKQERDDLKRNCVLRSKVRMIDDIPTRSMRKYCRDMAEAWKHVLPMLDKLGTDLGMPNRHKKVQ